MKDKSAGKKAKLIAPPSNGSGHLPNPRALAKGHAKQHQAAERERRLAFFDQAAKLTPYIATEAAGLKFLVSTSDRAIGGRLFASPKLKRSEIRALLRAVAILKAAGRPPSGDFLDIGANIGTTCLPAIKTHGFARAIAVEPSLENARLLHVNAVLNGLHDRVTVVQKALSDRKREGWLSMRVANSGGHSLNRPAEGKAGIYVQVDTLEGLVAEGIVVPERLGMVWIDVQGHEPEVLRGAGSVLELRPPLVVEVQTKGGQRDIDWLEPLAERYEWVARIRGREDPAPAMSALAMVSDQGVQDLMFF